MWFKSKSLGNKMRSLSNCNNIEDIRRIAKSRLPKSIFHYIDGGAEDEVTLIRNTTAFHDYELQPRFLRQIDKIDTSINLFGKNLKVPFFFSTHWHVSNVSPW